MISAASTRGAPRAGTPPMCIAGEMMLDLVGVVGVAERRSGGRPGEEGCECGSGSTVIPPNVMRLKESASTLSDTISSLGTAGRSAKLRVHVTVSNLQDTQWSKTY